MKTLFSDIIKRRTGMEIVDIIESNALIKDMLKHCPYDILKRWERKDYKRGEVICQQDMVHDYFYIIIDGYVNISRTAENGRKYSQSIYKKGDYFGELEIFDLKPYICSVEALTDTKTIRIKRKYFLQWISSDLYFSLYITRTLCDSFYKLSKLAGENTLYSLKYRICNYLLYEADSSGKKDWPLEVRINKEQLSEQFAVTSRSINRVLQYLKEKGLIDVSNNSIFITDIEGLRAEEKISREE